jgi:hypothetical protein
VAPSLLASHPANSLNRRTTLRRLTDGRGAIDVTPRTYEGRQFRLDDGSVIGYRPTSRSGPSAIDINIPGYSGVAKLHFVD